jgi:hypothetical protein
MTVSMAKWNAPFASSSFRLVLFATIALGGPMADAVVRSAAPPNEITNPDFLKSPQWTTGSRLLKLGESIQFRFYVPSGTDGGKLEILPHFLENASAADRFDPNDGEKPWLAGQKSIPIKLAFDDRTALVDFRPQEPGNYLARWQVNGETLYRYFSVVENDWVVIRFSTYYSLTPHPSLHGTGIPLDYRPPAISSMEYEKQYESADPQVDQVLFDANRKYGDSIIPLLPSTYGLDDKQRMAIYQPLMDEARAKYPDQSSARSVRIQWKFDDAGPHHYDPVLVRLGINDDCGMWVGNATPWLGMPEFPFFVSAADERLADQTGKSKVVAHQWDFTASWHFLGPVSWHSQASRGDFSVARKCLEEGIREYENLAEMSGHPAFVVGPLYDGVEYFSYPRKGEAHTWVEIDQRQAFVKNYLTYFAFEVPRRHKVVFARSIDVADYYLRHFEKTPRTIFSCKTDHVHYDMWWLPSWSGMSQMSFTQDFIPWLSKFSHLSKIQEFKDPLSYEYLLVEDDKQSIRFERNSPNPVWWFDYANPKYESNGFLARVRIPDVLIEDAYQGRAWQEAGIKDPQIITSQDCMPFWHKGPDSDWIKLRMRVEPAAEKTTAESSGDFPIYAICLWNIPDDFASDPDPKRITTNAREFLIAKNTDHQYHLVLKFDLKPDAVLDVRIAASGTKTEH